MKHTIKRKIVIDLFRFEFKESVDGNHPFTMMCQENYIPNPEKVSHIRIGTHEIYYDYEEEK